MKRKTIHDEFGPPENLEAAVNCAAAEMGPSISPDGLELYFSGYRNLGRPGGYGRADLWVTRRETLEDPWEESMNLGPSVNTPNSEYAPSISADGRVLMFARNYDIYQSTVGNKK